MLSLYSFLKQLQTWSVGECLNENTLLNSLFLQWKKPCSDKFKFPFLTAQRDDKLCPPPGVQFTVTYMKKSKNSPPCQQFFFQFPRQRYPIMPNRRSFILHSSLHSSPQLCLLTFRPAGRADVPMCRTHITFKNTKLTWSQSFQDVCVCACVVVCVCVHRPAHVLSPVPGN